MLQVDDPKLLREEIRQLKTTLAEREEKILQLEEILLPPDWEPPVEIRLTTQEARIVASLYKCNGETVSKDRLFYALYHDVLDQPEIKIVDVYICKARKKLAPYDVTIETLWGKGYYLTKESIQILKEWGLESNAPVPDKLAA